MQSEYRLERIGNVIKFLRQNPGSNLTLKELAEMAMFSEFHFHRIFKKVTGEPLRKYIKRLKMEKACSLLNSNNEIEIKELWMCLGYSTASHFSKDFKFFYGCTPTQYQKKLKERAAQKPILSIEIASHKVSHAEIDG